MQQECPFSAEAHSDAKTFLGARMLGSAVTSQQAETDKIHLAFQLFVQSKRQNSKTLAHRPIKGRTSYSCSPGTVQVRHWSTIAFDEPVEIRHMDLRQCRCANKGGPYTFRDKKTT